MTKLLLWLLVDCILAMLLIDSLIVMEGGLPESKPTNWEVWSN